MSRSREHRGWISNVWLRGTNAALVSMLAMVPVLVASQSTYSQTYRESVTRSFGDGLDGNVLFSGLVLDPAGNLYGTTYGGGTNGWGTVFKLDAAGKETVLYSFDCGTDSPSAGLVRDASGEFFGTTGGACSGKGTVFELNSVSGHEKFLYFFTGTDGDGANPWGGLVRAASGNLYGTTLQGGDLNCQHGLGCGTVFKMDSAGKETVLHRFAGTPDGALPFAGLVQDAMGNYYGTTSGGGTYGYGAVFKVTRSGEVMLVYSFTGNSGDGAVPYGSLIHDGSGNLYGTTSAGGTHGSGTVFKLNGTGKETVLYSFKGGRDGSVPLAALLRDSAGSLYGTTQEGGGTECGGLGCGVVFKLDKTGKEVVLHRFTGPDGALPVANLIRDEKGDFYSTTTEGGDFNLGTVFKLTPQ